MGITGISKTVKKTDKQNISLAERYFLLAEELRLKNQYRESVENYLHSIMIDRQNYTSYLGIGISYKNLKKYDKAVINLKKAEMLNPRDINVLKELAVCSVINGDFENGIKYLIKAIKLEPDNIDIQMQLAMVHEMIEEEDMSLMIYQRIIEMKPDYLRAYIQKAALFMHLQDYVNSVKIYKTVLRLDPKYYRAYLAVGICYEKLGNYSGAKRFYKKYIEMCRFCSNYNEIEKRISVLNSEKKMKNTLRIVCSNKISR